MSAISSSGPFLTLRSPGLALATLAADTQFLFSSVVASGIRVLSYLKFTRKDRFILAASASFGFGNLLVPDWSTYLFETVNEPSAALSGFFNSIIIVLSTPCTSPSRPPSAPPHSLPLP